MIRRCVLCLSDILDSFYFSVCLRGQDALCGFKATYKEAIKLHCPHRHFSRDILLGISSLPLGVCCFCPRATVLRSLELVNNELSGILMGLC